MITNFNTNLLVVSFEFVRKNGAVLTGSSTYLKLLIIHLITKNPRLGSKVYVCKYSLFICEKYKTFIL